MLIRPKRDRRALTRLSERCCPKCASDAVQITVRTLRAIYYRCDECWYAWSEPKPGQSIAT